MKLWQGRLSVSLPAIKLTESYNAGSYQSVLTGNKGTCVHTEAVINEPLNQEAVLAGDKTGQNH